MQDCDKRQKILAAAQQVVTKHGYTKATVEDIAHAAGVAKGTVYLYFKDKPDIMFGLIEQMLDNGLATIREVADLPISRTVKLRRIYDGWADTIRATHSDELPFSSPDAIRLASIDTTRLDNTIRPGMRRIIDALVEIIEPGIAEGEFRQVNSYLAATMFIHSFSVMFLVKRHKLPVVSPIDEIFDAYLNGLCECKNDSRIAEPATTSDKELA